MIAAALALTVLAAPPMSSPSPATNDKVWFVAIDGVKEGPLASGDIEARIKAKTIPSHSLVWRPGQPDWKTITDTPEFGAFFVETPSLPAASAPAPPPPSSKNSAAREEVLDRLNDANERARGAGSSMLYTGAIAGSIAACLTLCAVASFANVVSGNASGAAPGFALAGCGLLGGACVSGGIGGARIGYLMFQKGEAEDDADEAQRTLDGMKY